MNKIFSLYDFLIYMFLPFGQLFARINLLNSSKDKGWLLLFCFIPFILIPISPLFGIDIDFTLFFILVIITNIIPLLVIQFGKIKIFNMNENTSIDKYVLLPIIIKILIAFSIIYGFKMDHLMIDKFIKYGLFFASIIYSVYLRQYEKCETKTNPLLYFMDAIFIYTMTDIFVDIFNKVKSNTSDISNIPDLNLLFYIIGLFISHHFINYINDNDLDNYCSSNLDFMKIHVFTILIFVVYYSYSNISNISTLVRKS